LEVKEENEELNFDLKKKQKNILMLVCFL